MLWKLCWPVAVHCSVALSATQLGADCLKQVAIWLGPICWLFETTYTSRNMTPIHPLLADNALSGYASNFSTLTFPKQKSIDIFLSSPGFTGNYFVKAFPLHVRSLLRALLIGGRRLHTKNKGKTFKLSILVSSFQTFKPGFKHKLIILNGWKASYAVASCYKLSQGWYSSWQEQKRSYHTAIPNTKTLSQMRKYKNTKIRIEK